MGAFIRRTTVGFTIVELLIVVVVIAILAAITIVSYSGISSRASDSAAKSNIGSLVTKLEVDRATSSKYPLVLADISGGFTTGGDTRTEYTSDGATYCATSSSIRAKTDYYQTNTSGTMIAGKCPNHLGYQGGAGTFSSSSIFGGDSPLAGSQIYNDGGGSLWVGNRFYTTRNNGMRVVGARVWEPVGASAGFLGTSVSVQVFTQDWKGTDMGGWNSLGSSVISTTYSGTRTAGTWTYIWFPSTVTLAKSDGVVGAKDSVTIAVKYDGTNYVAASPPMDNNYLESSQASNVYLSESASSLYKRAVSNIYPTVGANYYYDIDLLFTPL